MNIYNLTEVSYKNFPNFSLELLFQTPPPLYQKFQTKEKFSVWVLLDPSPPGLAVFHRLGVFFLKASLFEEFKYITSDVE